MPHGEGPQTCACDGCSPERLDALLTVARRHGAVELEGAGFKVKLAPLVDGPAKPESPFADLEAAFARIGDLRGKSVVGA